MGDQIVQMINVLAFPASRGSSQAQSAAGYAAALLLVAISTVLGMVIEARWGSSPVDMLYLLPVLAAAIYAGLGPGLAAAAASALAFNYFFTAPYHTLVIHSPADIVTVMMLFVVAAVCSQLAASVRRQADLATSHAARNATIAGLSRKLLSTRGSTEAAQVGARQLAEIFKCHVVIVEDGPERRILASVPDTADLSPNDQAALAYTLESGECSGRGEKRAAEADWQFHPMASGSEVLAAIGLAREDGTPPLDEDRKLLFESLLGQMALALARARLEGDARDAAALRARDRMRSAMLGSIGDDIKPRLKAVQAVVKALRREGTADRLLVSELDGEVCRIERHIDSLVEVSPGDEPEAIPFGDVTIDLHRRQVSKAGTSVHLTPKEFSVLAELARHAGQVLGHAHLLRVVWGPAQQDHIDYLRVAVRALRQKLEDEPSNPRLILNEPGVGYRLSVS